MNTPDDRTPQGEPLAPATGADAPRAPHPPPPGAHLMNVLRWILFGFLVVLAAVSVGSYVMSRRPAPATKQAAGRTVWQCPMHPSYTSDKPGSCPICGMTLVQVQAASAAGPRHIVRYRSPMDPTVTSPVPMKDEMGMDYVPVWSDEAGATRQGDVPGLTSVDISPERVQLIGVRTARVETSASGGRLDLVGFVAPDESRLRRVQLRVSGWVRELYVSQTGEHVSAGQPLLAIYSPELLQTEQEYLIERGGGHEDMPGMSHGGAEGVSAAADRLYLLGVPSEELQRLAREGRAEQKLVLRSPVSGTVLERGVVQGQYVGADTPLFTVADLSHVWVLADVYEMDFTRVHVGDAATFTADGLPGRAFEGRVEFVYPTVSSETRTLKVRLSLATDGSLRPGMYGRVRLAARGAVTLSLPSEAVVNTGEDSYVFLAHAGGRFEPRRVWTGLPDGDRVQILRGVAAGDTVVASASFLIDSESRLKAAIEGLGAQHGGPDASASGHAAGGAR